MELTPRQIKMMKHAIGLDISNGKVQKNNNVYEAYRNYYSSSKPMVDYKGDVHLSESCLCPSFGNVNTDLFMTLFNQLRNAKPCLKCAGGKRFIKSTRPDIMMAKELFGL